MIGFSSVLLLASTLLSLPAEGTLVRRNVCPGGNRSGTQFGSLQANVGRKIALVIDSSGSNTSTDPNDLRVVAAKAFNDLLTTNAEAGANGKPDLVTVVDFDSSAAVIYELGDPAGATFDQIDSSGGTDIASGVKLAIEELTKPGFDPTSGRTGIIVLTDGEDSSITPLIAQINAAKDLGIRVNFGFLEGPPPSTPATRDTDLLTAILSTGGIHSSINTPEAQQYFVNLVAGRGPTELDGASVSNGTAPLLPGLTTSGLISAATGVSKFTYFGAAGEKLNFTISSQSNQVLNCTIVEAGTLQLLASSSTTSTSPAYMELDLTKDTDLELSIQALTNGSSQGVYSIGMNSSLPFINCYANTTTNSTTPPSTPSTPPTYTGGAGSLMSTSHGVLSGVFFTIMCSIFMML